MVSNTAIQKSRYSIILLVAVWLTLAIMILIVYQNIQIWSYNKIQPYSIVINLSSDSDVGINIQYDYGFGYSQEHQQLFISDSSLDVQTLRLNISAWKQLKKVRVFSTKSKQLRVNEVVIFKGNQALNLSPPSQPVTDENVSIEVILDSDNVAG